MSSDDSSIAQVFNVGVHVPTSSDSSWDLTAVIARAVESDGYDFISTPITRPTHAARISNDLEGGKTIVDSISGEEAAITSFDHVEQVVAFASSWIEPNAKDHELARVSAEVLKQEVAYASYCGVVNIVIPPPKRRTDLVRYAQAVNTALSMSAYLQVSIHMLMCEDPPEDVPMGEAHNEDGSGDRYDALSMWDLWNTIRTVCGYNARLSLALQIPAHLPPQVVQDRWFAEPVRFLLLSSSAFIGNAKGFPVLSKGHQSLYQHFLKLKPFTIIRDAETGKLKDGPLGYLKYVRYLQAKLPPPTVTEAFAQGYQDYLQAPLQPLMDNLESMTYEVFEKDPVKYAQYELAIVKALRDWPHSRRPVVAVAGAGRGPLVARALRASETAKVSIELIAVEKNPNAFVTLQQRQRNEWKDRVELVKSDMRTWKPKNPVDILVTELLGSLADNELSPECIDGVQNVLSPDGGISIPASYTAHISPIMSAKLFTDLQKHNSLQHIETPYVVLFQAADHIAENHEIKQIWEFVHPNPELFSTEAGASPLVRQNTHNKRCGRVTFNIPEKAVMHGIAGYFECVLYKNVELSTRPDTIEAKSKDMISWFPIFFPLKTPICLPRNSSVDITIWRETDGRKVWYEWLTESFMGTGHSRVLLGTSDLHNPGGRSSNIGL
ncbi:Skb1 methyltransferase [Saitoella complicata NRRL Y-17804]|uniref:Skb1 methyltransferase n=1 Tax=Saitoella complicata (strain BCRC 22490 / CBS 7301 / JCM 7358 / NBRC 10748 / NRRL Y-17804) TaxID=698492 RepID=UPI000867EA12|nr:Skb1 methyltransferase [Saitoella complicata NRRL Y-17804]ODQ52096.1 Skb1 methyltransferase [Saitoella complicata NRRL Y-17804]